MAKKSNAQIARMKMRAAARGEEYIAPIREEPEPPKEAKNEKKLAAAKKLTAEIQRIENSEDLKAKERRSAKRKAEAIAAEESGTPVEELLEWYKEQGQSDIKTVSDAKNGDKHDKDKSKEKKIPYILFVGQLSYQTTKEELFNHVKEELGKEHKITPETVRVRMLTDPKTNKSRGMAFLETNDPDLMYACLKLHQTNIGDRRINVERSAGGRKDSDTRKAKIKQYREEQEKYLSDVVNKLIAGHIASGEIKEGELDEGAIGLCKRHSAATVESTLIRYLETGGRDMDNPSAYFSHLIGKIATEGVIDDSKWEKKTKGSDKRRPADDQTSRKRKAPPPAQTNTPTTTKGEVGNKLRKTSEFSKTGVDMSISEGKGADFKKIFPSMNRGRGRGYM